MCPISWYGNKSYYPYNTFFNVAGKETGGARDNPVVFTQACAIVMTDQDALAAVVSTIVRTYVILGEHEKCGDLLYALCHDKVFPDHVFCTMAYSLILSNSITALPVPRYALGMSAISRTHARPIQLLSIAACMLDALLDHASNDIVANPGVYLMTEIAAKQRGEGLTVLFTRTTRALMRLWDECRKDGSLGATCDIGAGGLPLTPGDIISSAVAVPFARYAIATGKIDVRE